MKNGGPVTRAQAIRAIDDVFNRYFGSEKGSAKWKQPKWMAEYAVHFANTGGDCDTPEHAMNCTGGCTLRCVAMQSQVILLLRLRDAGLLKDQP